MTPARRVYKSAERNVWLAWTIVALISAWALFSIASTVERGLFPVVGRFEVLSIKRDGDTILIGGTLIKERDCEITSLRAMSENESLLKIDFLDRPDNATLHPRPIGPSSWGPWRVHPNGSRYVILHAEHRCHSLWSIKTTLAAFQVKPRYE
jgi:hypothetical protein